MNTILIVLVALLVIGAAIFPLVSAIQGRERRKLRNEALSIFSNLSEALDLRDARKETHSDRVAAISIRIAQAMHLSKREGEGIKTAARLHDLGKMAIPDSILLKPGPLTDEEWKIMRRHPVRGYEVLESAPIPEAVKQAVLHHHEHYDGSGYPDGLQGEGIPVASRIILVADAFVMITSDVPWRLARSKSEALQELRDHAGSQFDPEVVRVFESMINLI
jgi:HD-GYP domain-containing protein (c-di-GMP phosphodiesterase class II)